MLKKNDVAPSSQSGFKPTVGSGVDLSLTVTWGTVKFLRRSSDGFLDAGDRAS